jgi:hypothetical protein
MSLVTGADESADSLERKKVLPMVKVLFLAHCRWRGSAMSLGFAIFALLASGANAANPIQSENAKIGTTAWQIQNPASNGEIEGYASLTSVNRGGSIDLFVSTTSTSYTIEVYRMGWYGGAGGRRVLGPITRTGFVQPMPSADSNGMRECNWTSPYTITVPNNATDPTDWASGVYLVKLTAVSGLQRYIIFTVRDDRRSSDYLVQQSVNTWQAYNIWGGQSLYTFNSVGNVAAQKVSFNRPYDRNFGTGDFLGNITGGWEINMLRFLEREGYDVTYATNVDLHEQGVALLGPHKAFLSVGHDEYWSYQMRASVQQSRDQGKHLGFFGADAVYWQVRYESSVGAPQVANRTLVGYKEFAESYDPYYLNGDPSKYKFITTRFRDLAAPPYNVVDSVGGPENGLLGVMFHGDQEDLDIVVTDPTSWIYNGTGVVNGTRLVGLLGYEDDALFDNQLTPPGLQVIAQSPDPWGASSMVTYTAANGAVVVATGSMQWIWGLDDYNSPQARASRLNPAAQQATRNILARFAPASVPVPPAAPASLQATPGPGQITLSWSPVIGLTTYNVYRATSPGAEGSNPYKTGVTATSYTDATPVMGTTNYYQVTAVNSSGQSGKSNEASAVPQAIPPPPAMAPPTNLAASANGRNVKLTWSQSASAGVAGVNVYRATTSGGSYVKVASLGTVTGYTDNQVNAGTNYYYVVRARNASGIESGASNEVRVMTR